MNYNIDYSKAAHKYPSKSFYNKTNKKKYDTQSRQYNVYYTNIIAIKNVIISKKARTKRQLVIEKAIERAKFATMLR